MASRLSVISDFNEGTVNHGRAFPTMEQVKHVIAAMPNNSEIERRNRALVEGTWTRRSRTSNGSFNGWGAMWIVGFASNLKFSLDALEWLGRTPAASQREGLRIDRTPRIEYAPVAHL